MSSYDIEQGFNPNTNFLNDTLDTVVASNSSPDLTDVAKVKKALYKSGYYQPNERVGENNNALSPYPTQELFDSIKSFQRDNNLTVDGIIKPKGETENALNLGNTKSITRSTQPPTNNILNNSFLPISETLGSNYNVNLDDVLNVKKWLLQTGDYVPNERVGETPNNLSKYPDMKFYDGIKSFQNKNGLNVDGIIKPRGETANKFEEIFGKIPTSKKRPAYDPTILYMNKNEAEDSSEPKQEKESEESSETTTTEDNKTDNKPFSTGIDSKIPYWDKEKAPERAENLKKYDFNNFYNQITTPKEFSNNFANEAKSKNVVFRNSNPKAGEKIATVIARKMNDNSYELKNNHIDKDEFKLRMTDGGIWDYKNKIQNEITNGLMVKIKNPKEGNPDTQYAMNYRGEDGNLHYVTKVNGDNENVYDHDIWSNVHYGYVGKANDFSPIKLRFGNYLNELKKDIKDPEDWEAIKLGMRLWDKYGSKGIEMTPEILNKEIMNNGNKLNRYST